MPQVLNRPLVPLATTAPKVFTFTVTLRHERTEDEQSFEIETPTESLSVVIREIQAQRAARGLFGYVLFETIDHNTPF
jgi:hypothetical protein